MWFGIGDYPAEYKPKVHGPYDPARYYGKPDNPLAQVKLAELPAWLARRNKGPRQFAQLCSRAWWRWHHKYVFPRNAGIVPFFQYTSLLMGFFYIINYGKIKRHRNYKYH